MSPVTSHLFSSRSPIGLLLLAATLVAGLSACSSSPRHRFGIAAAEQTGLIIGTVTAGSRFMKVQAVFESTDGQNSRWYVESDDARSQITRVYDVNDGNVQGDVFALELPAGEYAFVDWNVQVLKANMEPAANTITPLPFTVVAGQTSYIGNLHFMQLKTRDAENVRVPTDTWAVVNDKEVRDAKVLYARYPELRKTKIVVEPMDGDVWRKDFEQLMGYSLSEMNI